MKVTCTKCPKTFDKPNRLAADQALRMHVARVHDRTLVAPHEHSGVVRLNGGRKGKLSAEEVGSIVGFIQSRRDRFPSKQACFTAALEHAGVENKIRNNSVAVQRYFSKAENSRPAAEAPVKRKYTKRQKPVQHDIHVNFCPNCGCNIHAVAVGMATALVEK